MHILIAPNAFKNSLNATDAAEAISKGLQHSHLQCSCECFPVGDGGDGTAALLLKKLNGTIIHAEVHDPLRRKINTTYGLIDKGKTAVIEMADASGLRLLKPDEYDPLHTTSFGTGELMKLAIEQKVNKIILCIGGSSTVDGAAGIAQAMGIRFLDINKNILSNLPEDLVDLESIDMHELDQSIFNCELIVLCDVENVLLGENGAAEVYGPQKGATLSAVKKLEAALTKLNKIVFQQTGKDMSLVKHGGAAGGMAAGLYALLNANLVNGTDHFLEITGFENALQKADLVITGEGSIDEQTLHGKAPYGVALRAKRNGIPVIGFAGKVPLEADNKLQQYFDALLPIGNTPGTIEQAISNTYSNLQRTAMEVGNLLALQTT